MDAPLATSNDVLKLCEERYRNWNANLATLECVYRGYRFNIGLDKSGDNRFPYRSSLHVYSQWEPLDPIVAKSYRLAKTKKRKDAIDGAAQIAARLIDELIEEVGESSNQVWIADYHLNPPGIMIAGAA